jgi:hypothetical protein
MNTPFHRFFLLCPERPLGRINRAGASKAASDHLSLPIDRECAFVQAGLLSRLPAWILRDETNDLDAMLASAVYPYVGIGVTLVHQVHGRKQVATI